MDRRFRERIKKALRKLTWSWYPYRQVKDEAKVDKATFRCVSCGKYCYVGKSKSSLDKLIEKYPKIEVEMGAIYIDHILPVEDPINGWSGWDVFMERLFCDKSNLQPLCGTCHKEKTDKENSLRRKSVSSSKNAK